MKETLEAAARELGLDLSDTQIDQLLAYLALLQKWNKVYNLTAVRDPAQMLSHHLVDSLSVIAPLKRHGAPARDAGPGLAHLRHHASRHLAVAGASEEGQVQGVHG